MSEELVRCPRCRRGMFTLQGLARHVCKSKLNAQGEPQVLTVGELTDAQEEAAERERVIAETVKGMT